MESVPRSVRWLAVAFAAALAAACGSGSAPAAPTASAGTQLQVPTVFLESTQKINATNNELTLTWIGNAPTYQLVIGSTPGSSNILPPTVVTGATYTWVSPRTSGTYYARVAAKSGDSLSGYSDELSLYVLDIRDVIDAMYFHAGPMADNPANANSNPVTGVWADGTHLRVLVSSAAGDPARVIAQTFADQYAALVGGEITATSEVTSDPMQETSNVEYPGPLADFTVGVRVQSGVCPSGALACAIYGPAPIGPNKSVVTLAQAGPLNISSTAHEMGHAYGMGHIAATVTGRPEFRFMMNPSQASEQMTDTEKLAVTIARNAGLRAGWTRDQALRADLVNPYTGTSSVRRLGGTSTTTERRTAHGWIQVDAASIR